MILSLSGWRQKLDKLKKSSLIFKLGQLRGRVEELNDQADGQVEVLNILSNNIDKIVRELEDEKPDGEGEV